ncbi:DNL zinc finger-domain-containing protein [Sporodiniella umbellata]|nr:DNL zinc finger-domain-containing protein [Sporodiniella umbellata]
MLSSTFKPTVARALLTKRILNAANISPRLPKPILFAFKAPTLNLAIHKCHFHAQPSLHEQPQLEKQDSIAEKETKRQMLIGFTCKVCEERSHHVMSRLAYTKGVVLIQCPGCKNRHLIADNLGWFKDSKTTVEDLVKEKGEAIRKVVVDEQGAEKMSNLLEWLPEIVEEEKVKKTKLKQ